MVTRRSGNTLVAWPGERFSGLLAWIAATLLAVASPAAEPRTWRSAGGDGSFVGTYLSHDQRRVTIRRNDGRVFTLDLDRLHADDREWLANKAAPAAPPPPAAPDETAVFDDLKLGDLHSVVSRKLSESELLELAVPPSLFGRFGLNGSYRTRARIGGQACLLYFDWTDSGSERRLRELSLQTEPTSAESYRSRLLATWREFSDLLTKLHGPPVQAAGFPSLDDLSADGMFLGSHLWRLENGHSAMLGTARDAGRFSVVVRFTTESIAPVPRNAASSEPAPEFNAHKDS